MRHANAGLGAALETQTYFGDTIEFRVLFALVVHFFVLVIADGRDVTHEHTSSYFLNSIITGMSL